MSRDNAVPTQAERIVQLHAVYEASIANGTFKPYVYPIGAFGVALVILYHLVPHRDRPYVRALRFPVWLVNLVFSVYILQNFRARQTPIDYGVGLITWWFVLWTTAVMIAYDGQVEFTRIEHVQGGTGTVVSGVEKYKENGTVNGNANGNAEDAGTRFGNDTAATRSLIWQSYPTESFVERVDWVTDLLSNFRGMSWNWRIHSLPAPPKDVQILLDKSGGDGLKRPWRSLSPPQPTSRRELLRYAFARFCVGYLCLDFIRTLTIPDPYFRGLGTAHKPAYLPTYVQDSPMLLQAYRLLIGLFAIYWALATIFSLAPLFFVGVLSSSLIGVRGEPWMYPREWGSFTAVLDRGLAGWWGTWWHQTFRFAFEAPSKRLVEVLDIDRRSLLGKTLQLFIAFALSGSLHTWGSHTSIGHTRPMRGPFLFFIIQPFGIMGQLLLASVFRRLGIATRVPVVVRRTINFVVVHAWFFCTAPLLIDDLASGGTFLYEPVPVSIFRFLGLGGKDEPFVCWQWPWFFWHTSDRWWESGVST